MTEPVSLAGTQHSPEEFERMIRELAAGRRRDRVAAEPDDALAPGPTEQKARLTVLAEVPRPQTAPRYATPMPTALAADADRLLVHHHQSLFAVDWRTPKILWTAGTDENPRPRPRTTGEAESSALLRAGGKVYVRQALPGRPLGCFETATGRRLWSRPLLGAVASEPILAGGRLAVITGSADALRLERISPETGESDSTAALVPLRQASAAIGRPVLVGDAILFRAAGCLIQCSHRGTVRWARRLPHVPASVLGELHTSAALADMVAWHDKSVILTAPGCPQVLCVSVAEGELAWSAVIHSATRLVGLVGGSVILSEPGLLRALDPATGAHRWQRRIPDGSTGVLPARDETLLLVRLAEQRSGPKDAPAVDRYVQWISARDGKTVTQLPVEGDPEIHSVSALATDGARVFGTASAKGRSRQEKVFLIELGGGR